MDHSSSRAEASAETQEPMSQTRCEMRTLAEQAGGRATKRTCRWADGEEALLAKVPKAPALPGWDWLCPLVCSPLWWVPVCSKREVDEE